MSWNITLLKNIWQNFRQLKLTYMSAGLILHASPIWPVWNVRALRTSLWSLKSRLMLFLSFVVMEISSKAQTARFSPPLEGCHHLIIQASLWASGLKWIRTVLWNESKRKIKVIKIGDTILSEWCEGRGTWFLDNAITQNIHILHHFMKLLNFILKNC